MALIWQESISSMALQRFTGNGMDGMAWLGSVQPKVPTGLLWRRMGLSELLGISDTHYWPTYKITKYAPIRPLKHGFFSTTWVNEILYIIHGLQGSFLLL